MPQITEDKIFGFAPRIDFQVGHDVGYPEDKLLANIMSCIDMTQISNVEDFRNQLVEYSHTCYRRGYVRGVKAGAEDVIQYLDNTGSISISTETISDAYFALKDTL